MLWRRQWIQLHQERMSCTERFRETKRRDPFYPGTLWLNFLLLELEFVEPVFFSFFFVLWYETAANLGICFYENFVLQFTLCSATGFAFNGFSDVD